MLEFKTILKTEDVNVDDKQYLLKELDGQTQSLWRKHAGGNLSVVDGKATITGLNMQDPEMKLLSLCLYDISGPEEVLVSISTLQKWPTHVIKNLYEAAKTLSGLDEESKKRLEDEGKNS